jgi:hypothetical protein
MNNKASLFRGASALVKAQERIVLLAGKNSVVDNNKLPRMPRGSKVILPYEVYQTMKMIGDMSNQENFEVPFLLFGHSEGQTVFFDDIEADASSTDNNQTAVFSQQLVNKLATFCSRARKSENKIIAHGHSHPRIGSGYLNYSFGDIKAYIDLREKNENVKSNVDTCGCLLTGGNYNFVFYDGNDTYRFDEVFVKLKDGRLMRVPSFGPDTRTLQNINQSRGL